MKDSKKTPRELHRGTKCHHLLMFCLINGEALLKHFTPFTAGFGKATQIFSDADLFDNEAWKPKCRDSFYVHVTVHRNKFVTFM